MKRKLYICLIGVIACMTLFGCGNKDKVEDGATGAVAEASVSEDTVEDTDMYLSSGTAIAELSNTSYYDGSSPMYHFKNDIVYLNEVDGEINLVEMKDLVKDIVIADKTYQYDDLFKSSDKGLEIVELFNEDFGIIMKESKYGKVVEKPVSVTKANILSYASDSSNGIYTFYFNAKMSQFDETLDAKRRDAFEALQSDSISRDNHYMDGVLCVEVEMDGDNCLGYTIYIEAPTYWDSDENFESNMTARRRFNNSYCNMTVDGTIVGFDSGVYFITRFDDYVPEELDTQGSEEVSVEQEAENAEPEL